MRPIFYIASLASIVIGICLIHWPSALIAAGVLVIIDMYMPNQG